MTSYFYQGKIYNSNKNSNYTNNQSLPARLSSSANIDYRSKEVQDAYRAAECVNCGEATPLTITCEDTTTTTTTTTIAPTTTTTTTTTIAPTTTTTTTTTPAGSGEPTTTTTTSTTPAGSG